MKTDTQQNSDMASTEQASNSPQYDEAARRQTNCCQRHSDVASNPSQLYTVTFSEYHVYSKQHSAALS